MRGKKQQTPQFFRFFLFAKFFCAPPNLQKRRPEETYGFKAPKACLRPYDPTFLEAYEGEPEKNWRAKTNLDDFLGMFLALPL